MPEQPRHRWWEVMRARMAPGERLGSHRRSVGWQPLLHPVPGHSTIDGLPVAVVAVRRNAEAGDLEVVRGYHPTAEWPGAMTPPNAKRHVLPARSFIPHPRRELNIGGHRFFFSTVANAVRCASCGRDDNGFGFVSSDAPTWVDGERAPEPGALCEPCAEIRMHAVGGPA